MSKNTQQYPPENIQVLDENASNFADKVFCDVAKKFRMTDDEIEAIVSEVAKGLSKVMSPEYIGTIYHPMGFQMVDPKHFKSLNNLRINLFLDLLMPDDCKGLYMHELSLMLLEIKELRAVLQQQFNYNWTEHRKHFPLIAQSVI